MQLSRDRTRIRVRFVDCCSQGRSDTTTMMTLNLMRVTIHRTMGAVELL